MQGKYLKWLGFAAVVLLAFLITFFLIKKVGTSSKSGDDKTEVVETHENVKVIKLTAVSGRSGEALASKGFSSGVFSVNISASLGDPEPGMFYEAWLTGDTASNKYFSLGKLQKVEDKYNLTFTDTKDYPEHKEIIVSMEPNSTGLDAQIETRILGGSF